MPVDLRLYADDDGLDNVVVSRGTPASTSKGKARAQPSEVWDDDFAFQTPTAPARRPSKSVSESRSPDPSGLFVEEEDGLGDADKTPQRRRNKSVPSPQKEHPQQPVEDMPDLTRLLKRTKPGRDRAASHKSEVVPPPTSAPPSSYKPDARPRALRESQSTQLLPEKTQRRHDTLRTSRPPLAASSRSHLRLGGSRPSYQTKRTTSAELPSSSSTTTYSSRRSGSEEATSKPSLSSDHENWDDDFPTSGLDAARPALRAFGRTSTDESSAHTSPPTSRATVSSDMRPDSALSFASVTSVETQEVTSDDGRTLDATAFADAARRRDCHATPPAPQTSGSQRSRKEALRGRPSFSLQAPSRRPSDPSLDGHVEPPPASSSTATPSLQSSQKSKASDESGRKVRKKLRKKRPSTTPTPEDENGPSGGAGGRRRSASSLSYRRSSFADSLASHFRSASRASGLRSFADDSGDEGRRRISLSSSPYQMVTAADLSASPPLAFPSSGDERDEEGPRRRPSDANVGGQQKKEDRRRPLSFTGLLTRAASTNAGPSGQDRKRSSEAPRSRPIVEVTHPGLSTGNASDRRRSKTRPHADLSTGSGDTSTASFLITRARRLSRGVVAPASPLPGKERAATPPLERPSTPMQRRSRPEVEPRAVPARLTKTRRSERPVQGPRTHDVPATPAPTSPPPPPSTTTSTTGDDYYDDFDVSPRQDGRPPAARAASSSELRIPASVMKAQSKLNEDLVRVKDFAKGIEDLKAVREAYRDLLRSREEAMPAVGAPSPSSGPLMIPLALRRASAIYSRLDVEYGGWWDCCDVLIELAEGSDPASLSTSTRHRALSMHPSTTESPKRGGLFAPAPPVPRSEMSMQILKTALGVQTPSSSSTGAKTLHPSSRSPSVGLPSSPRSTGSHSSGESAFSLSPQLTPTRRLASLNRITSPVLQTKRSASRLFQKVSSSPAREVPAAPRIVEPSETAKPGQSRVRTGIPGIKAFLRVLKARMNHDDRRALAAALPGPDVDARRSVSDPVRNGSPAVRSDSSDEDNWDGLIASSPSLTRTSRGPEAARRARTHSTGSLAPSALLGGSTAENSGARLALTTEGMPQLLEYVQLVREQCNKGLDELRAMAH